MELPAFQTLVFLPRDAESYTIFSTVLVTLDLSLLHSQVTCQVTHSTLQSPLSRHVNISRFLQGKGPPQPSGQHLVTTTVSLIGGLHLPPPIYSSLNPL